MVDRLNSSNGAPEYPTEAGPPAEQPLDFGRVATALRRNGRLVAVLVVLVSGTVLAASLLSPPRYRASARIAEDPASVEAVDIAAVDRRLATSRELVTAPTVLEAAARRLGTETAGTIAAKVSAAVDPAAGILDVRATDADPAQAARIANAVAATFLAERAQMERRVLARARRQLTLEVDRLRRRRATRPAVDALRERLSELAISEVMAGSALRLVQPAAAPAGPYAPRPLRSTLLASFATLLIGVLIALALDRLRPRAPDAHELSRIVGLPLLAALPDARRGTSPALLRRLRRRRGPEGAMDQAIIEEAALQASVRLALPPSRRHVVLIHAISPDGGGDRVAAGLARSLSWAGHATVLVVCPPPDGRPPEPVHLTPDGVSRMRCTDVEDQFGELERSDYRYIIVESPHGGSGVQLPMIARHATVVMLVARLGLTSAADAAASRRIIDALGLHGLGLVLTGSAEEAAAIGREGFALPLLPPGRPRGAFRNGARRGGGPTAAEAEPSVAHARHG